MSHDRAVSQRLAACGCEGVTLNVPATHSAMHVFGLGHFREPAANDADAFRVPGFTLRPGFGIVTIDGRP